jgi:SAM-dependent methyltransferase
VEITTFTPEYFAEMAELERHHAWTSAMRAMTFTLIEREARGALEHVLDVGCGSGLFLNEWLTKGTAAFGVGVDLHADALGWARARQRGTWVRASAGHLPFRPGSFDAIHSADVLQHLSFDDTERALALFASLLASGGILALRVRAARIFRRAPEVDYSHSFSPSRLRGDLQRHGFVVRFLSHVNALPSIWSELSMTLTRTTGGAVKGIHSRGNGSVASRLLAAYLGAERAWLLASRLPLPIGHTLICVARRS